MKKIFSILLLCFCAIATWAAKANGEPVTITQPDGTLLTIVLHGDEHANWYTTLDGALLVQQSRAYYVARVNGDGSLASTGLLAHQALQREASELQAIAAQDKAFFLENANQTMTTPRRISISTDESNHYFPHTGTPKALVILVDFTDTTFTLPNPKASFEQYLNGEGAPQNLGNREDRNAGSVRDYFKTMSNGAYAPSFDVVGPYHLANELKYYGAGSDDMSRFIPDACKAADADVNFADYDADGDGYVDLVYVIYAGYSQSQAGNSTECIWPKSGTISGGTYDGKQVYRYGVSNELIAYPAAFKTPRMAGLGLFLHEFSHTMGLPDLYATSGSTGYNKNNQGFEYWSLMDGGEYVNNGYNPASYTAWEREVMGWFAPEMLTDTCSVVGLAPINDGGKAYKIFNGDTKEYVMLENVQDMGWNWSKTYGHGLIAYRVNYAKDVVNALDRPNNTLGKPQVVLLPADGNVVVQDSCQSGEEYYGQFAIHPYPGESNVTSVAAFAMLDGSSLEKPLRNIAEADGLISFDFLGKKSDTPDGITAPTICQTPQVIYTLAGRYLGTDVTRLSKGIYVIGGKKYVK